MLDALEIKRVASQILNASGFDQKEAPSPGFVVWITGLSGAGKTTVSSVLQGKFREAGLPTVSLDGDVLRAVLSRENGHGKEDRRALAHTYGRLCKEISSTGIHVICATISMFHEVRDWNRANCQRYFEVYLRVPLQELKMRDPKLIYQRADRGELLDVVGVHFPAEEPKTPDMVIDNFGEKSQERAAENIWLGLLDRGILTVLHGEG